MDNDYELLYLLKEEPEEILDILYKKYNSVLYYKIKKYNKWNINSDDYLNIARLSLYEAAENYHDNNKFITYLNTCLDRSLSNYKKSLNRNKNKILNDAISIEDDHADIELTPNDERYNPERLLFEETNYQELKNKIIGKLSWKEELIFILKEQNYTNKEISEITDNSLRTVYNIINRIKNKVSNIVSN